MRLSSTTRLIFSIASLRRPIVRFRIRCKNTVCHAQSARPRFHALARSMHCIATAPICDVDNYPSGLCCTVWLGTDRVGNCCRWVCVFAVCSSKPLGARSVKTASRCAPPLEERDSTTSGPVHLTITLSRARPSGLSAPHLVSPIVLSSSMAVIAH